MSKNTISERKKYSVIYADPPWSYQNGSVPQGGVDAQYSTMKLDDIKALPVAGIAADPCILFMWATFPMLREALSVIDAWGFEYKTLGFSWLKTNRDGTPFFGIGYYAKSNAEVCLMAVRGKKPHAMVKSNSVSSAVLAPKSKHSSKPAEVRKRIECLLGDVARVELFAREKVSGWDCWGNEVENSVNL